MMNEPIRAEAYESSRLIHHLVLSARIDPIVELLDLAPRLAHRESFARDRVSTNDCGCIYAGILLSSPCKCCAHPVDHAVGRGGGDDLAPQAMRAQETLA